MAKDKSTDSEGQRSSRFYGNNLEQVWKTHAGKKISKHVKTTLIMIPWSLLVAPKGGIKGYKSVVEVMAFCHAPCSGATSKSRVEGYSDDIYPRVWLGGCGSLAEGKSS